MEEAASPVAEIRADNLRVLSGVCWQFSEKYAIIYAFLAEVRACICGKGLAGPH
jgi:hypothetical protein